MKCIIRFGLALIAVVAFASFVLPAAQASAAPTVCATGWEHMKKAGGGVDDRVCCPSNSQNDPDNYARDCFFAKYLNPTVRVLSALAAVAVIIGIVIGGIQYSSSGGDPQKAAHGKGIVVKSLYALFVFLFLFGILQFFSPGGIGTKAVKPVLPGVAKQCANPFLGIQPWFIYLPDAAFVDKNGVVTCNVDNFELFGKTGSGQGSYLLNVGLAVLDALIRIAGLIAVAFVIVGGAKYITSQGEPDKASQARGAIINALIGLVIAIVAAALVSFIGNRLTT